MNLKVYLRLLRPGTLVAPLGGGLLFGLMAIKVQNLALSPQVILLGCLSGVILACANGISNITNQIHDRDIDALLSHKKNRPIPAGEVDIDEAISIVAILTIVVVSLAWLFFPPFYGIILSIIMVFAWMYNSPPLRLRKKLLLSNLAIAAPRGGLGIVAAYSAFADPLDPRVLIPAAAFALYVFGANTLKDYADCEADRKMGVRNFVTVFGPTAASYIIMPFLFAPFILFEAFGISELVFLAFPVSMVMLVLLAIRPTLEKIELLMWKLFYLQFALMMLLYTMPFILGMI